MPPNIPEECRPLKDAVVEATNERNYWKEEYETATSASQRSYAFFEYRKAIGDLTAARKAYSDCLRNNTIAARRKASGEPEEELIDGRPNYIGICPYCREKIHPDAIKCPHCQSSFEDSAQDQFCPHCDSSSAGMRIGVEQADMSVSGGNSELTEIAGLPRGLGVPTGDLGSCPLPEIIYLGLAHGPGRFGFGFGPLMKKYMLRSWFNGGFGCRVHISYFYRPYIPETLI